MTKGPDAFRTISEVAEELELPQHVLRFWETRFPQIRPMKRGGGRRYYRPDDVELLRGIRKLLYGEGYTIKGVQRILKEQGARHVIVAGGDGGLDPAPPGYRVEPDFEGEIPDGILVDEDDVHLMRSVGGARSEQRREPVFSLHRDSPSPDSQAPSLDIAPVRGDGGPVSSESAGFASRIPLAPPADSESADVYLPPQTGGPGAWSASSRREPALFAADRRPPALSPAERGDEPFWPGGHSPHDAPIRAAGQGSALNRPPIADPMALADPVTLADPTALHEEPRFPRSGTSRGSGTLIGEGGAAAGPLQPGGQPLAHDEIDRLKTVLFELLECKRILDQAR